MFIKVLGCILIVFSSASIGLNHIGKLKNRVSALCEIIEFINIIKIKIGYELCDIPNMFESLSDKYLIAQNCSKHLKNETSLKSAWYNSVDEYKEKYYLKSQDIDLLKDFCVCLGQTDIEGQISNFNMYSKLIEQNLEEAKEDINDKSKVIFSTSMFAGLLISILLI